MSITTNEQYRNIVLLLRTYRLIYKATYSSYYLALYHGLLSRLYGARVNGLFIVISLASPSVVSIDYDRTQTITQYITPIVA